MSIASAINTTPLMSYSTASTSTAATGNSVGDLSSSLNLDFSTYIKILTTQLQNQDPTNATDPNQFTQELVEMGGVEQQINTNTDLTDLLNQGASNSLATGTGYIGNYVAAASSSDEFALQGGNSEFSYNLASAASNVTITIQDANGDTVGTYTGTGSSGFNDVTWNGQDDNGNQLSDGLYTFNVAATDGSGNAITVSDPTVLAQVTSVQTNSDGTLSLQCGDLSVSSANVGALYTPNSLPAATALTASASSS